MLDTMRRFYPRKADAALAKKALVIADLQLLVGCGYEKAAPYLATLKRLK
jgi:hypothetical protein